MRSWLARIREQRNDRVLGGILIGLGLLCGWSVALFFFISRESIHLSMLLAPAGFIFIGILLIYSDGIERSLKIQDEIQTFPDLIQDDFEDLRARKLTPTHAMVVITLLSLVGQITCIFLFRKWQATWTGCLNVVVASVLAGFLVGFIGLTTKWFQVRKQRFSWGIYIIPLIAYALSAFLGIYYAEPEIKSARDLPVNQSADYQYTNAGTRINQVDGEEAFSIMDGAMDIDCDDEACLVLILIVIAIACIAASAFIPHFWVVATTILWVIMLLITTREVLFREGKT